MQHDDDLSASAYPVHHRIRPDDAPYTTTWPSEQVQQVIRDRAARFPQYGWITITADLQGDGVNVTADEVRTVLAAGP